MRNNKKFSAFGLGLIVMLGGCNMETDNIKSTEVKTGTEA